MRHLRAAGNAVVENRRTARHGRWRWALLLRRGAMMPWLATRSNRQNCDGLRSCTTTHGRRVQLEGWSGYPSIAGPLDQSSVDRRDGPLGNIMHGWKW